MSNGETKIVNSLILKGALERFLVEPDVQIRSYNIETVKLGGLSRVFVRFRIGNRDESIAMLAKVGSSDKFRSVNVVDGFDREVIVYKVVFTGFVDILKRLGGILKFGPDLIFTLQKPSNGLFLEDLENLGFKSEKSSEGLNLEQSKAALEKVAFFHAVSIIFLEDFKGNSTELDKLQWKILPEEGKKLSQDISAVLQNFVNQTKSWDLDDNLIKKLENFSKIPNQKGIVEYVNRIDTIKVINHGGLTRDNIFFKYDRSNDIQDVIFTNFQHATIGSPILDLTFFLTSSVAYDVLLASHDELIFTYHEALKLLLEKLAYRGTVPPLIELHLELLRKGVLEATYAFTVAPYLHHSGGHSVVSSATLRQAFDAPDFLALHSESLATHSGAIKRQLAYFESRGTLDFQFADSKIRGLMSRFEK